MGENAANPPAGEPPAGETPATPAPAATDEQVAQNYFDDEMGAIHQQLDELKQAVGHLAASMQAGAGENVSHAGNAAGESAGPASGAAGGAASASGTAPSIPEPEHNPRPTNRWWRPIRGG